jgi:hypothetical protein
VASESEPEVALERLGEFGSFMHDSRSRDEQCSVMNIAGLPSVCVWRGEGDLSVLGLLEQRLGSLAVRSAVQAWPASRSMSRRARPVFTDPWFSESGSGVSPMLAGRAGCMMLIGKEGSMSIHVQRPLPLGHHRAAITAATAAVLVGRDRIGAREHAISTLR